MLPRHPTNIILTIIILVIRYSTKLVVLSLERALAPLVTALLLLPAGRGAIV